jgi:CRISPR-associated endonuclease Cas2
MWIFVLFDLPVGTKKERKAAAKFRHVLLDLGFEMSQFSVYLKFTAGKEQAEALERQFEAAMPPSGKVHVVQNPHPKIRISWRSFELAATGFLLLRAKKKALISGP